MHHDAPLDGTNIHVRGAGAGVQFHCLVAVTLVWRPVPLLDAQHWMDFFELPWRACSADIETSNFLIGSGSKDVCRVRKFNQDGGCFGLSRTAFQLQLPAEAQQTFLVNRHALFAWNSQLHTREKNRRSHGTPSKS